MSLSTPVESEAASPYAHLIETLKGVSSQPLWDRYHRVTSRQPHTSEMPLHWTWDAMEPLVDRAVAEVSMEDAERRVLLLTHPKFPGTIWTMRNISGGLQTILPGEVARAHRHALAALRFVMSGSGGITTVNDEACPMEEGDLILTPSWTWHEHTHPGEGRMVWFDGLDLPLCNHLDTMFFEMSAPHLTKVDPTPSRAPAAPNDCATLLPDGLDANANASSRFRYSAKRAVDALNASLPRADGSKLLRYVHPAAQGSVLPTLDCYLMGLQQNRPSRLRRTTASAICVVAEGEGTSSIGDESIHWKRNDVFTVPHWQWASHTAASPNAKLFFMTDREMLAGMGYLREEEASS